MEAMSAAMSDYGLGDVGMLVWVQGTVLCQPSFFFPFCIS